MAWKSQCGSKIPCVAALLVALLPVFANAAKKGGGSAVSRFDRELKEKTGALDSIKAELVKGRARLRELQKEEGSYLAKLEQISKNVSVSRNYLDVLERRIDETEALIEVLGDSLGNSERQLRDRQSVMRMRLRRAYIAGTHHFLFLVLTAGNPMNMLHRARYLQEMNRYDRRLAARIDSTKSRIDRDKKEQEAQRSKLTAMHADKEKERDALVEEERTRRGMLESVRNRKSAHEHMIAELESAQKELDGIIKLLEAKKKKARREVERKATLAFEKRKGKLPWPIDGRIAAHYGKVVHPVYKTVTMNHGIDIDAGGGKSVQCVAPGVVIHVGWMRGLGKLVIVDHSGGYLTVYAHLNEIKVASDERVELGETIGQVGGGAASESRLHFQVRKTAETLDPEEWLGESGL